MQTNRLLPSTQNVAHSPPTSSIQPSSGVKRRSVVSGSEASGKRVSHGTDVTSNEDGAFFSKKQKDEEEAEKARLETIANEANEFCDMLEKQKHKYDRSENASSESDKSVEIMEVTPSSSSKQYSYQQDAGLSPVKVENKKKEKKSLLHTITSSIASIFSKKSLFEINSTTIGTAGGQEMKTKDFQKIVNYFKSMDYTSNDKRFTDFQVLYLTQLFACALPGTKDMAFVDPAVFNVLITNASKTWLYNFNKKTTKRIFMAICYENHWWLFYYSYSKSKLFCFDPRGRYEPPTTVTNRILNFLKIACEISYDNKLITLMDIPCSLRQPPSDGWSCGMRGIDITYLIIKKLPIQEYPSYNAEKQRELYIQLFKFIGTYSNFPIDFFEKLPFTLPSYPQARITPVDEQQPSASTTFSNFSEIAKVSGIPDEFEKTLPIISQTSETLNHENVDTFITQKHNTLSKEESNSAKEDSTKTTITLRQQIGHEGGIEKSKRWGARHDAKKRAALASVEKRRAKSSGNVKEQHLSNNIANDQDPHAIQVPQQNSIFKPRRSSSLPVSIADAKKVKETEQAKKDLEKTLRDTLTKLENIRFENQNLQQELTDAFNRLQNVDFKYKELQQAMSNVVEQLNQSSHENQQLRIAINDAINKFNNISEENQSLQSNLKDTTSQLANSAMENQKLLSAVEIGKAKVKHFTKEKRNLIKKVERRELPDASGHKPWKELTIPGQTAAIQRIKNQILNQNPMYSPGELAEIVNKAFPTTERIRFSEKETLELQWQGDITAAKFELMRKTIKQKLGYDVLASKRNMIKYRKRLHEECPIDTFSRDEIIGAVIRDVVKAIIFRISVQKKSGTYSLADNEKLKLCLVSDEGGGYTSLGLLLSSLAKRNSPDAMLLLGIFKGKESRKNLELAFKIIEDQLKNLKSITVDGQVIEIEFFKTADLKLLKTWRGIRAGNAKHSCIVCILPNDKTFAEFKDIDFEIRKCEEIDESICQDELPFFSFIDTDHIILPGLHLFLGIVLQIIKILFFELRKMEFNQINETEKKIEGNDKNGESVDIIQGNCDIQESQNTEEISDDDEIDDEKLVKLQNELENSEDLAKEWTSYCELVEASFVAIDADDNDDDGSESETSKSEEDEEDYYEENNIDICAATNCIVKTTGKSLPERPSHGAKLTPYKLKYKNQHYHTICVGLNNEEARNQQKKKFVAVVVTDDVIKQTIKDEATAAYVNVNDVKAKLEKEFYKNMAPEKDSKYVKVLEKIFQSFGATRQIYYQTYTGNHIHLILQNASSIEEKLIDPETGKSIVNEKMRHCCTAMEILSRIQSKFAARMLTDEEIDELENDVTAYAAHMKAFFPEVSVTHKQHKLLRHIVPYARKWKTLNFFSEAPIEHQHHVNKERLKLISTRNEFKKCEFLLQRNWEHNIARDQGRIVSNQNIF